MAALTMPARAVHRQPPKSWQTRSACSPLGHWKLASRGGSKIRPGREFARHRRADQSPTAAQDRLTLPALDEHRFRAEFHGAHRTPLRSREGNSSVADRSAETTPSYASVTHVREDLRLVGSNDARPGSMFSIAYRAWEWPTTRLLPRLPPATYSAFNIVPSLVSLWGAAGPVSSHRREGGRSLASRTRQTKQRRQKATFNSRFGAWKPHDHVDGGAPCWRCSPRSTTAPALS